MLGIEAKAKMTTWEDSNSTIHWIPMLMNQSLNEDFVGEIVLSACKEHKL